MSERILDAGRIRAWLDARVPAIGTFVLRRGTMVTDGRIIADGMRFPDGQTVTRSPTSWSSRLTWRA